MIPKQVVIVSAPVSSRSGYGTHSRLIIHSLIAMNKYDIKIIPTPWGSTPTDALDINNIEDLKIINLMVDPRTITDIPDLWIQITIPNEMMRNGKVNLLITAGTEASTPPESFIEGANRADYVIVPSEFTKNVLVNAAFEKRDKSSNQVVGHISLQKPIMTLFEGLNLNIFNRGLPMAENIKSMLNVKEDFCFLCTGMWLSGILGEDRKDISGVIKTFLETFKGKADRNKPALILKTSGAGFSEIENDIILQKIEQIRETCGTPVGQWPSIYLLHGDFTDQEMNSLYNHPKVKALVCFSKGEGFGLPLLEFAVTGKPIICSKYSGQLDFLNPEFNTLLPGKVTPIHPSAANEWLPRNSSWFTVDYGYAAGVMSDMLDNYDKYMERSKNQTNYIKENFSLEKMTEKLSVILDNILPQPQPAVKFELPTLNLPKIS